MAKGSGFVVDASVGAKLLLPEGDSAAAQALFDSASVSGRGALQVPDLFFAECANALRKGIERYGIPARHAAEALREICAAELESFPARALAPAALELARSEGLSVHDALYVALSDSTGAPLVTADRRLLERLRRGGHRVVALADLTA